jgi:hypothetical protein
MSVTRFGQAAGFFIETLICPRVPPYPVVFDHPFRQAGALSVRRHRRRVMLIAMSAEPGRNPTAPPLPAALLRAWPFITLGALGWLIAVGAAFLVPSLQSWRPVALAGLGVGVLGTSIFLLQLAAARRGARGAQAGLENFLDHK